MSRKHSTSRRRTARRAAAVAAVATAGALATTTPAHALLGLPLLPGQPDEPTLLDELLQAQQLCSAVPLPACDLTFLESLQVQFVTEMPGQQPRLTSSLPLVPTPLDVDDDVLPDVEAQVVVLGLDTFQVKIKRLPGETSALPAKIEAIVKPPVDLPRDLVAFGYDARASKSPKSFIGTAKVGDAAAAAGAKTVVIDHEIDTEGSELTIVGGLFDGTAGARTQPLGGELRLAPVPATPGIDLTATEAEVLARLRSPSATSVQADVVVTDGPATTDLDAAFAHPGGAVGVQVVKTGEARHVTYRATNPVTTMGFDLAQREGGVLEQELGLDAKDLPTEIDVDDLPGDGQDRQVAYDANGELGEVAFESISHTDTPGGDEAQRTKIVAKHLPDHLDVAYDVIDDAADKRKVIYTASEPLGRLELDLDTRVAGQLKSQTFVDADGVPTGVTVDQSSHDAVEVTATGGAIADVAFGTGGATVKVLQGDEPWVRSWSHEIGTASGDEFTADEAKTTSSLAGRVKALQHIKVDGADAIDVDAQFAFGPQQPATPLRVTVEEEQRLHNLTPFDKLEVEGRLEVLPDHLDVRVDPVNKKVDYDSSAGIGLIRATADKARPFFQDVDHIEAEVRGVPKQAHLTFDTPGEGAVTMSSTAPIGFTEVTLNDMPDLDGAQSYFDSLVEGGGSQGVAVRDVEGAPLEVFARVYDLRSFEFRSAPLELGADIGGAGFKALAKLAPEAGDPLGQPLRIDAELSDMPDGVHLAETADKRFEYEAQEPIAWLDVQLRNLPGEAVSGEPRNVHATVQQIPTQFKLDLGSDAATGELLLDAPAAAFNPNGALDAEVRAWDHGEEPDMHASWDDVDYAHVSSGPDSVLNAADQQQFRLVSKLTDVWKLRVRPDGGEQQVELNHVGMPQRPFNAQLRLRESEPGAQLLEASAHIPEMPQNFRLDLAKDPATIEGELRMSDPIEDLHLHLQSLPSIYVDANIKDVPAELDLCLDEHTGYCGDPITGATTAKDDPIVYAEDVFGPKLGAVALEFDTRGTATEDLHVTDATICGGDDVGLVDGQSHCSIGDNGMKVQLDDMRIRDLFLAFGGGNLCASDGTLIENELLGVGLDAPTGFRVDDMFIGTTSTSTDCDDDDAEVDTTHIDIEAPDAVIANDYHTILDTTNSIATDVFLEGSIQCPESFLVEEQGLAADLGFNLATFLTGCDAGS